MHWNDQFAVRARVDVLAAAVTDPVSGQPASKSIPARMERFTAAAFGFAVLRNMPACIPAEYWAIAKCRGGWRLEMAFAARADDWARLVTDLVGGETELVAYHDAKSGQHRFACYENDGLAGVVYLASEPVAVSRAWAIAQLGAQKLARGKRTAVIAGRPAKGAIDRGATVCACFGVGAIEIAAAAARGCATVSAIGEALQAGTNCGSCCAEIRDIIAAQRNTEQGAGRTLVASV
jgi:assimilatory nitrate reductase catalytic subunit